MENNKNTNNSNYQPELELAYNNYGLPFIETPKGTGDGYSIGINQDNLMSQVLDDFNDLKY